MDAIGRIDQSNLINIASGRLEAAADVHMTATTGRTTAEAIATSSNLLKDAAEGVINLFGRLVGPTRSPSTGPRAAVPSKGGPMWWCTAQWWPAPFPT